MSIRIPRNRVNRTLHRDGNNQEPTVLHIVQNPPGSFYWFGNDGHRYSPVRDHKTTAINDAINGSILKQI